MGATTPEQRLAAAILAQAYSDMFLLDGGVDAGGDTIAVQAMRYLTDRHGSSAHWRNKWCAYLDHDGDLLATQVRKILDGEIDPPADSRFTKHLDRARDRWARLPKPPKPSGKPLRLPSIRPPKAPPPTPRPTIDPKDIDLCIPDDPFYPSRAGHLVASRRWADGEVSRYLGPLPPFNSKAGQLIWTFCQVARNGRNAFHVRGIDPDAAITTLKDALPACDVLWSSKGKPLTDYRPNAGLRLYLK